MREIQRQTEAFAYRLAGDIKLYHHTSEENALKLLQNGFDLSDPERPVYLTTKKKWSPRRWLVRDVVNPVTVEVTVPREILQRDQMQPRAETWYYAPASSMKGIKVHVAAKDEYRLAEKSFDYTLVDRLEGEFNDWAKKNNATNPSDLSWAPRGPIGHWPNIELFLKDRYPAAHRNLAMGDELSRPLMDRGETPKYRNEKDQHPPRANPAEESLNVPYETGPEALAKYGYDPKEITAAMLLLHNDSHIGRTLLKRDQNRLNDIARKRHKMQEAFEMAHHAIRLAENTIHKIAADLVR